MPNKLLLGVVFFKYSFFPLALSCQPNGLFLWLFWNSLPRTMFLFNDQTLSHLLFRKRSFSYLAFSFGYPNPTKCLVFLPFNTIEPPDAPYRLKLFQLITCTSQALRYPHWLFAFRSFLFEFLIALSPPGPRCV